MPAGRPTKYKQKYCEEVIEHLSTGKSLASFAASIGTHREVIWQWRQKFEEFNNACNTAMELSQRWWENLAVMVATGKTMELETDKKNPNFGKPKLPYTNPGMIQFMMKQRFSDYRNIAKREDDDNGTSSNVNLTVNLNGDELTEEIDRRIERRRRRADKTSKGRRSKNS